MCDYCNTEEYSGDQLPADVKIDGKDQSFEAYILDDVEYEQFSLHIDGTHSDIRIKINYCPICGNKL